MDRKICDCCGKELCFQWSDSHGIGVCTYCGLPYRIYHYEDDKRAEKPPEVALKESGVEIAKRYWLETHRRVFPAAFDMGILPGRGYSYSGATEDDCAAFSRWYKANVPPADSPSTSNGDPDAV